MSVIGCPLKGTGFGEIVTCTLPTAVPGAGGAGAGVGAPAARPGPAGRGRQLAHGGGRRTLLRERSGVLTAQWADDAFYVLCSRCNATGRAMEKFPSCTCVR